jgi:hypothetical protein
MGWLALNKGRARKVHNKERGRGDNSYKVTGELRRLRQ